MTPKEFRKEMRAFRLSIGPDAYVTAGINDTGWSADPKATLDMYVCPHGITRDRGSFRVYGEDWGVLLAAAKEKWTAYEVEYGKQTSRKMALAIIRITADLGHCTDAALRNEFSDELVKQYGQAAVADANKIAANGPFDIVKTRGANGAPDDIEAHQSGRVQ